MAIERERSPVQRTLSAFLDRLLNEGVAAVFDEPGAPAQDAECESILQACEAAARNELASEAPPFSIATATWAARIFYLACKFVVCRDFPEEELVRSLAEPCPEPRSPATDWSADLVFRHLPEVYRSARHLSSADPLLRELLKLATAWPLSSVGIPLEQEPRLQTFVGHPALGQLYVDRILELAEVSRLGDPRVNETVRAALGAYPELCPALADKVSLPAREP